MDAKNSADLFHNGEYDLAGATRRIAELEWALCVARRALDADAPDGAREAFRTIALDPTFALDHALDGAWRMGRLGDPHPCADSADPRSRKLAEVAAQETEGLLAGLIRRLRKAFSERMATPDT